jgi:hypothetical protein
MILLEVILAALWHSISLCALFQGIPFSVYSKLPSEMACSPRRKNQAAGFRYENHARSLSAGAPLLIFLQELYMSLYTKFNGAKLTSSVTVLVT